MTPTSYCYFDYYQSGSPGEPLAIGGYLPLEKVYAFQPVPKELSEGERKYILGGQANLWTEYLPDFNAVCYSEFPRLVAMAEVLWTEEKNRKSYNEFVVGLNKYVFPYFDKRGINYSRAAFEPKVIWDYDKVGITLSIEYPLEDAEVNLVKSHNLELNENIGLIQSRVFIAQSETKVLHTYSAEVRIEHQLVGKSEVKVYSHLGLGCNVRFKTPPSEKYNVHGDLGLVDGVVGAKPWKGDQWLGFENDTVQFSVNLSRKQKVGTISLGTLDDPGSWIYRPREVQLKYSANGKKWKTVQATLVDDNFVYSKKIRIKYLYFTIINDETIPSGKPGAGFTPWTFLDELIITK